ncbi:MAG: hypothetical protein AB2807_02685 [Candidatus Sedimenticola endophacoides]
MDLYRQAFDDAFDKHDTAVKQQLTTALTQADRLPVNVVRVALAKNTAAFAGYQELQSNQTYTSSVSKVAEFAGKIETSLVAISNELPDALDRLRAASVKKQDAPHAALEPVNEASVSSLESQVQQHVFDYNTWIGICNAEIAAFKKGTNAAALKQRLPNSTHKCIA